MSVNVDEDPFDELFDRTLVLFTDRLGVIPDGIERSPISLEWVVAIITRGAYGRTGNERPRVTD